MRRPAIALTVATLIVSMVGVVDAAIGQVWDLFVLFLVVAALQLAVIASSLGNRVDVSLRPDLARFVVQRSQRTGEPVDDVVDRSVAWFQHGLYGSPSDDGK